MTTNNDDHVGRQKMVNNDTRHSVMDRLQSKNKLDQSHLQTLLLLNFLSFLFENDFVNRENELSILFSGSYMLQVFYFFF